MNRREFVNGLGAIGAVYVAGCGAGESEPAPPITIGQIDLTFHVAAAAIVARVLTDHGHPVERSSALHEEMFARMQRGEVDLLSSAWLPGSHGAYLKSFEDEVEKLAVLYEPYAIWGVPDYVPKEAVARVADLVKADVAAQMTKTIQGIGPGAGISRFSVEIMKAYGLAEAGYQFRNGTQEECEDAFTGAFDEGRWVVVPLWHPQHLHYRYPIRELAEPMGLLRGKDDATLLLRRDRAGMLDPKALRALRKIKLGNDAVTYLDYLVNVERRSPDEAADLWFHENPAIVDSWIS